MERPLSAPGELASLIAAKDWSATPLGPIASWPASLRNCLRLMLSSRYAMWMGWGPDLSFFYNDAYAKMTLGPKHPGALGRPFREVWSEAIEELQVRVDQVFRTGEGTWDEGLLLFLERNGYPEETYHTFSYSVAPGDTADAIGGLFCVVMEETERVIGERRLATLRDLASRLSAVNDEAGVMHALEGALARNAKDFTFAATYLFDGDAPKLASATRLEFDVASRWPLRDLVTTRAVDLPGDVAWPSGDWSVRPRHALLVPIPEPGGARPAGVFIAGLNPHRALDAAMQSFVELFVGQVAAGLSSARAYETARKRAEALAEIDRAKTAFFSNVSHEFRTPLTLMLGPTEDALASPERALRGADLETVHRNELRLLKLVNALLDFARIEAGRIRAAYEPTDLAALTADLASSFRSAVERGGLAFEVRAEPMPEPIWVDHDMWEKIVLNLLSNALKFTFEGSIEVSVRPAGDHAELVVRDTGVGVAPHEVPRLFERFHRVEGSRARTHEGSGIGLALVHDLVHLHGGTIHAASELGRGTTFTIAIPRGKAHLPADQLAERGTARARSGAAFVEEALRWTGASTERTEGDRESPVPAGPRARIVVADDNADMRDYITRLLGERWDVEAVANGNAALAALRREPAQLVLSDVMMPDLDGFGLVAAIRADPMLKTTPVILLSARAGEEASAEGLEAGADDYVVKPFVARDLVVRVASKIAAAASRRETLAAKESLALVANRLRAAQRVAGIGIFDWDLREGVWYGSPELFALMGLESGAAAPSPETWVAQLADPSDWERFDEAVAQRRGTFEMELRLKTRWIRLSAEIQYDGPEPVRVLGAAIDIEVLKEAAAARANALEVAERNSRAKDEFLATMSHELRTPLNAMLGWARILRSSPIDDPKVAHGLAVIERNAESQARLVSDLLDVSRIISGKLRLALRSVEVGAVVHAAAEVVRQAADAKGVRLVVDVDPAVGSMLGDPDRLQQIVWNLLINAVKFTPARGRVVVTADRRSSTIELEVVDTGAGIPSEHLESIFERFRQVDSSSTRAHGGLGLGLAIVRHLAEAHGGTVEARSEGRGKGAAFKVVLPIRAVFVDAEVTSAQLDPGSQPPPASVAAARLHGLRVLTVDDEADSLELVRVVLEGAGAVVEGATTAAAAIERFTGGAFDVVVSDIGMPELDGYALIAALRRHDPHVRAVALTAYARTEDAERALHAGYQRHLAKPIDARVLVATVAAVAPR